MRGTFISHAEVRCPACGKLTPISSFEGALHEEGSHDVECGWCDHPFQVETSVRWSFESPPRPVPDDAVCSLKHSLKGQAFDHTGQAFCKECGGFAYVYNAAGVRL